MNRQIESLRHAHLLVRKLKRRRRKGWQSRNLSADSIAEHTFGSILLAWIIAHSEGVDTSRVLELSIIHELVMAELDDVTPSSTSYATKDQLEEVAKRQVVDALPLSLRDRYIELFDEYQAQKSREANVARDAAKLETLLQGKAFENSTGRTDILDQFLNTYGGIIATPLGKLIFEDIRKEHMFRKQHRSSHYDNNVT